MVWCCGLNGGRSASMTSWILSCGDAVDYLSGLDSGSVNLVLTDPAYESLEKHRKLGTTTRLSHSKGSSNDWFHIFPNDRFPEFLAQCHRVLADNAHLYLMCDQETMFVVKPLAESVGFKFWKPLVWDKLKIGMGYHYRCRYEFILFFEKGKRKLNDLSTPDILAFPRIKGGYPTEKPVELCRTLITQSTQPGEIVCDPFMGSGSTGVAALRSGRRFWGNDVSQEAVSLSERRVQQSQTVLFEV